MFWAPRGHEHLHGALVEFPSYFFVTFDPILPCHQVNLKRDDVRPRAARGVMLSPLPHTSQVLHFITSLRFVFPPDIALSLRFVTLYIFRLFSLFILLSLLLRDVLLKTHVLSKVE